jgi:hypothetical protein
MNRTWLPRASLALAVVGLLCWVLTFMAGTDIWHDAGRPDFLRLGATDFDLHALAVSYYLMPAVLSVLVGLLALTVARDRAH